MNPQGTWLSKPTGLQPWDPEACSERKMAPKELMSTHSSQDPAQKCNSLKDAQVQCEESPSTNLQVLAREAGTCWDTLWGWKLVSPISELCLHLTLRLNKALTVCAQHSTSFCVRESVYKNEGPYEKVRMLPSPCLLCSSHDRPVNQLRCWGKEWRFFFSAAAALGIFSCSMWESSSLTRDQTEAP